MNLEGFKSELLAAQKRIVRIGLILFLICAGICAAILAFSDTSSRTSIVGLCIFGPFTLIGLLMFITSNQKKQKIKSGDHELIKAIQNKTDLVVWVYQQTMTTQHEMMAKKSKNFHIMIHKKDGKFLQFMPKTEAQVQAMIQFLSEQFPNAVIGYSEENRKLVSQQIGKEIKA